MELEKASALKVTNKTAAIDILYNIGNLYSIFECKFNDLKYQISAVFEGKKNLCAICVAGLQFCKFIVD
jgi:hypothetical protein